MLGPLLFPIAYRLGIHEVYYAMASILSMGVGLFPQRIGVGYYLTCAIGDYNPNAFRHNRRYLLALLVGLAIVAAVPRISMGLL